MTLYRENEKNQRRPHLKVYTPSLTIAIFLFLIEISYPLAQLPRMATPAPATTEPAKPVDPLGRDTPRHALMGFLKRGDSDDYETAARYLQPIPGQHTDLSERARELHALQGRLKGNIALLSDDPNGTLDPGLRPGQVRAGTLVVGSETADFILIKVDDPDSGKIWLISKDTVAQIPKLYAALQREAPSVASRIVPASLTARQLLGMSLAQWAAWFLSIPLSLLLAGVVVFLLSLPGRVQSRLRQLPSRPIWETRHFLPLKGIIAILLHMAFVYLIGPPILYRVYYFRLMAVLLVACFVWLTSTITDRSFEIALNRARTQHKGGESILILLKRLTRVGLLIIAVLVTLSLFGVDVRTTLAGLGIGGIAIVLAAQKTLENLIGGISLLMDKAVQVGDFCRIGDQLGTVEDIGLRSLKLRTLGQNLLVVPNGSLAQMEFQNMTRRSKLLISQTFSLRIESQAWQLRFVLDRVQNMLNQHPGIERDNCRVRVTSFVGAAFQLELFAYGTTGDMAQFSAIQQDVILKIAEIVEASGTRFAAPTQLAYISRDKAVSDAKANDVGQRHETDLEAGDVYSFPNEIRTGTR